MLGSRVRFEAVSIDNDGREAHHHYDVICRINAVTEELDFYYFSLTKRCQKIKNAAA